MHLNIPSIINKLFLSLILFLICSCSCCLFVHAQELNPYGNSYHYDFSQTQLTFVLNKEGQGLFYWPPFNAEELNLGVLLYAMLLKYSLSFERAEPYGEPDYQIRIIGPGQIRTYYLGLGWLEFEDSVALLNDEDYEELLGLIELRFNQEKLVENEHIKGVTSRHLGIPYTSELKITESIEEARRKIKPLFENSRDERWENFEPEVAQSSSDEQKKQPVHGTHNSDDKAIATNEDSRQAGEKTENSSTATEKEKSAEKENSKTTIKNKQNNEWAEFQDDVTHASEKIKNTRETSEIAEAKSNNVFYWILMPLMILILSFVYARIKNNNR